MREPLPPMSAHWTFCGSTPWFFIPPTIITCVMSPCELMPTVTSCFMKSDQLLMKSVLTASTRSVCR